MPSRVFGFKSGWQKFNIPAGVKRLDFVVRGGSSSGTQGGRISGFREVTGSQEVMVLVGEAGNAPNGRNGGPAAQGGGGHGGDANGPYTGGYSGGGASVVRMNSTSGALVAVAGGAGGKSGDQGPGGEGGAGTGESGGRGNDGNNQTSNATGGTPTQGGNRGTSSRGNVYNGTDANNDVAGTGGKGGAGGDPHDNTGHGGGGGAGGYRCGGGGQASAHGYAPGGGGGGGSNYGGGMKAAQSLRGESGTGHGQVTITWTTPADPHPKNNPPHKATAVHVDGTKSDTNVVTMSTGKVSIEFDIGDPDFDDVTYEITYSRNDWKTHATHRPHDPKYYATKKNDKGGYEARTVKATLTGLSQDSKYDFRIYVIDRKGKRAGPTSGSFYTNRQPTQPELHAPPDNANFPAPAGITFGWTFKDPDLPKDGQSEWQLRWRWISSADKHGDWTDPPRSGKGGYSSWVSEIDDFRGNQFYEWTVRTRDKQGRWSEWQERPHSFHVTGVTSTPIPITPNNDESRDTRRPIRFDWQFVDPQAADNQIKADVRWRVIGAEVAPGLPGPDWHTVLGSTQVPGHETEWLIPADSFPSPGYRIEWQARTYDDPVAPPSDWSDSATFWTYGVYAAQPEEPIPDPNNVQGSLGCGAYRVFLYQRGGQVLRGELTPISQLNFGRVRDDISNCIVQSIEFGADCGELLASIRCWMHEIAIFRNGVRVWEGPITRISYTHNSIEFEAKDCMAYVYRRILKQGFNDQFYYDPNAKKADQEINKGLSVVTRAATIIADALARDDPNLLAFLTPFEFPGDAKQTRFVADYAQTAWQQVDDMAATAGLDYTTIGRRILLWDTHRPIGRLPEMRDGDFSDPPVVTEYGMQLCNFSAVTNNNGLFATATAMDPLAPGKQPEPVKPFDKYYGPIEMLASSYSEQEGDIEKMGAQAQRNINDRWPTPLVVRVPDNSTLNPDTNLGFQQLVPGVWIPLRSTGTIRSVEQWQKLDSVTVSYTDGKEQVAVVMSPAPVGGSDPDLGFEDAPEE